MWEWFWAFTTGWSRADYFSVIVVLAPLMLSLIVVTVIQHNWHEKFLRRSDVSAQILFWMLLGLFTGVGAVLIVRFLLPGFGLEWLEVVLH